MVNRDTAGDGRGWNHPHSVNASSTTASTVAVTLTRFHGPRVGVSPTAAACVVGDVNARFVNASANFAAVSNRSAANLSNDLAVAAATWGGTDFLIFVTGSAGSVTIFMMIACADPPVCGGSPVNISYNTLPNE